MPAAGMGSNLPNPALTQERTVDDFAWAPSGGFYLYEDSNLVHISSDGSSKTVLLSNAALFGLNMCPDGKTLLLSWIGQGSGLSIQVWRTDANGANSKQLSFGKIDMNPVCSSDSKQLYYSAVPGNIMHGPVDGSRKPEIVPGSVIPNTIIGYPLIGLSPDGKLLAFVTTASESVESSSAQHIALVPLDEGVQPHPRFLQPHERISTGPRFTPDGKSLVYFIHTDGVDNLWLQPLDGSPGRQISNFPTENINTFHWSPDGKTLAMLRGHTESDVVLLRDSSAPQ